LFWGLVLVFSLLLSFGRATPLFFIFKLPLMNFFRIPPRFLFFSVFALITLTGYGFDFAASLLRSSKLTPLFALCSLLFAFLDLFSFSYNYHPTVTAKDWIETPPATASCLQAQDKEFRIVDAGSDSLWNQIFWHYGWDGDTLSKYKNLRNSLFTNSSVYWNIKTAGVYSGVQLQNIKALFDVLKKEVTVAPDDGFVLSKKGVELLSYLNVRFFVSPVNLVADNFSLSFHADFQPPAQEFAVFENKNFLPRVRFVENLPDAKITNTSFSNQKIEISYEAPSDNRLLLVDTYYPGWRAFIDGKETKIFPADFYGKFILAPKGTHKVEFVYQPRSFRAGGFISLVSFLIWGSSVIVVVRSHKNLQFSIYNFQSISNHTIFN
ncbi:MAG: YfhO family protein, partial [Candidatus Cloacimonetes bacterium]|nr:YfhO family protein [Candidatus Cloacimonadota bacterium]